MVAFYMGGESKNIPGIAVASGSSVFVYKNLKPFFKFNIPQLDVDPKVRRHAATAHVQLTIAGNRRVDSGVVERSC